MGLHVGLCPDGDFQSEEVLEFLKHQLSQGIDEDGKKVLVAPFEAYLMVVDVQEWDI